MSFAAFSAVRPAARLLFQRDLLERSWLFSRRYTHVVRRVYELERPQFGWYYHGRRPNLPGRYGVWEVADVEQDAKRHPEMFIVEVQLTGDVAGLGSLGDVVRVQDRKSTL